MRPMRGNALPFRPHEPNGDKKMTKEARSGQRLNCLGTIKVPESRDLLRSNWTLGCETLDRDFADFDEYKKYIPALGIKTLRLQAGWAKTEKKPGEYDFAWLDKIIDGALAMGCEILLETDYGNPAYPGGGGHDLSGGFPVSREALEAWDRWVEAMALRYRDKISDWANWNEPDINPQHKPSDIAAFNIRTSKIIKRIIPNARIAGLSLASPNPDAFEECVKEIAKAGELELFDWFIYHGYTYIPEESFAHMERLKRIIRSYSPDIRLRQGENGCPSETTTKFALRGYPWSETSQAKWDLRRFLGDLGHDVESSVFTICDFNHKGREINRKGLLLADAERRVIRPKQAYGAIRNMAYVFDGSVVRTEGNVSFMSAGDVCAFSYRRRGGSIAVYWDRTFIPVDTCSPFRGTMVTRDLAFSDPVLADLRTGRVYEIPAACVKTFGSMQIFDGMPCCDSPLVIGERGIFL